MGRLIKGLGLAALIGIAVLASGIAPLAAAAPLKFSPIVYVDKNLAGGEPFVIQSTKYGTLLYSSHEGTTHLYKNGFAGYAAEPFASNYRNQVNQWVSTDNGKTWSFVSVLGTGFVAPTGNSGFSDPDLTADEGGRIYNTGINLANDALFSSGDGGKTFDRGTIECASGDRPWLAGGKADNVFLSSNLNRGGHQVLHSGDGGNSCDAPVANTGGLAGGGIVANGTLNNVRWAGDGKLYYDHVDGSLVEPAVFSNSDGTNGIGIDYLAHAQAAYPADGTKSFSAINVVPHTTVFAHWPAIAIDGNENVYVVWDTDPRSTTTTNGCSSSPTPLPNQVMMVVGKHTGPQAWSWSAPITVASPAAGRVLWPWVQVGAAGNVSVVWYQYDKVVDPDCATDGNVFIYDAHVLGALGSSPDIQVTNASDRSVHTGGLCQSGTTCVATGQDRRLGDFLTNAVDDRGCVMIVSGDTTLPDPVTGGDQPISHPIFIRQFSGPSLTGGNCAGTLGTTTTTPTITGAGAGTPNTGRAPLAALGLALALLATAGALAVVGLRVRRAG